MLTPNGDVEYLDSISERVHQLLREGTSEEVVYHYTSAAAAMNILRSGELWASHNGVLNDPDEVLSVSRHWVDPLAKFLPEIVQNLDGSTEECEAFADTLRLHLLDLTPSASSAPFILSFSSTCESLPQWKEYADDGHGVAIGVKTDWLRGRTNSYADGIFGPVRYGSGVAQGRLLRTVLYEILEPAFAIYREQPDSDRATNCVVWAITGLSRAFGASAPFLKGAAYEYEQERRLVTRCLDPAVAKDWVQSGGEVLAASALADIAKLHMRVANRRVVPYIPVPLRDGSGSGLHSLVLGPCIADELHQAAFWVALCREKWPTDTRVLPSSIRYRSL